MDAIINLLDTWQAQCLLAAVAVLYGLLMPLPEAERPKREGAKK